MKEIKDSRIIVVKVGTSTLTYPSGMLNLRRIDNLVKTLCDLQNSGRKMILVSSGAVSAGLAKIGFVKRPETIEEKQAAAAVGQCELMNMYDSRFSSYGHKVAQILITRFTVESDVMRRNAEGTFRVLLNMGCIPIVNENDSVSYEGLKFGGNDLLAAYVATLAGADCIINMSDVDGLFDSDPRTNPNAKLIERVEHFDQAILQMAGGAGTARGTGGMKAKIDAALIAAHAGIPSMIVNGANPEILYDIMEGTAKGTVFAVDKV
ncbi:MAG: glutamate 5-kinase [Eubacteriales bacterium]